MFRRKLKHFDLYISQIEAYASSINIEIKYDFRNGESSYSPMIKRVYIDPELSHSEEIAQLLHELGHSLDDTLTNPKTFHKIDKAYQSCYNGVGSKKQNKLVVECERRAWDYAEKLAKLLKIRLGKWFWRVKEECLSGYTRK